MKHVVSTAWLKDNIENPQLIILDSSPESNVSGLTSNFVGKQIPGAVHFNLKKDFSDPKSDFPNTLPSPEAFQNAARKLGINNNSIIVVYDNLGIYTSARVWWLFKIMGHKKVFVLNGGLPAWAQDGYPLVDVSENKILKEGNFVSDFNPNLVVSIAQVKENITSEKGLLIDARSPGRFNGTEAEPRKGLRSGNIPKSINIPYKDVLEDGKFKSREQLRAIFTNEKIKNQPLYFSCGSGLTACIVMMASDMVTENEKAIYDGSWTEWGQLVTQ